MKLLRLKITDPAGFRSLPCGFEHYFRTKWSLQDETARSEGFAPFVCAGPNGSGKSNLLEALAGIFYHLECLNLTNKPDSFDYDKETNPKGFQGSISDPGAFELEYLTTHPYRDSQRTYGIDSPEANILCHIEIQKCKDESPIVYFRNWEEFRTQKQEIIKGRDIKFFLPEYVVAYSSGENEILSLPFFKMRFIQFDEYMRSLREQQSFPGRPETSHIYLDDSFSQAILLSNLLFPTDTASPPFCEKVGLEALQEFRIIIRRSIPIEPEQLIGFDRASADEQNQRNNKIRSENPQASESEWMTQSRRLIVKSNPALYEVTDAGCYLSVSSGKALHDSFLI